MQRRSPFQGLVGMLVTFAVIGLLIYAGFYIAKGLFTILSWVAPALLVVALILNYKVVLNYGKWLINLLTTNTLFGIVMCLVTIFGFPVVTAWLCFKAILTYRMKQRVKENQQDKEGYIDYEEVDSEIHQKEEIEETADSQSS